MTDRRECRCSHEMDCHAGIGCVQGKGCGPASSDSDTYPMPAHGWTCFHCGETFTTPGAARDHFGETELEVAGCQIKAGKERGLLMALRKAERELDRYRAEDSDKDRELRALAADHHAALRREEEKGYERGLADGRALGMSND